jgi:hypothetical protein
MSLKHLKPDLEALSFQQDRVDAGVETGSGIYGERSAAKLSSWVLALLQESTGPLADLGLTSSRPDTNPDDRS